MWLQKPECLEVIKSAWERGSRLRTVEDYNRKIGLCRLELKRWSKRCFGNNRKQIDQTKQRLQMIVAAIPTPELQIEEKVLKSKIHALWKYEEIYWRQRSGVRWLKEGDRNSKFFHQTTLDRRRRNKIVKLRTLDRAWIEEEEDISKEIFSFYKNLFG